MIYLQNMVFLSLFFCNIVELTSMKFMFVFFAGMTSCPKDLNWHCKGVKEELAMCSWNWMFRLFWGMEGMEFQCSTHFYLSSWMMSDHISPSCKNITDGIHSSGTVNGDGLWWTKGLRKYNKNLKARIDYWRWRKKKLKIRYQMYMTSFLLFGVSLSV
jgi:hypothetical protein